MNERTLIRIPIRRGVPAQLEKITISGVTIEFDGPIIFGPGAGLEVRADGSSSTGTGARFVDILTLDEP